MAKEGVVKFGVHVRYVKFYPWGDESLGSSYIFRMGEARYIKFGVLTDTEEYQCTHNRLATPEGCVQGHVTSVKFRK